ncbi:MAG: hypothetical protein ACK41W_16815 [Cyanobacteriota bacterium]|jgi:hypothetical protein
MASLPKPVLSVALGLGVGLASAVGLSLPQGGLAQTCQFLSPVGGDGVNNIVAKTISPGNPLGRPNWNTDFFVTRPYRFYKLFFTADSSVSATYPIQAYLKFTDGSTLRVVDENLAPQLGTGRHWDIPAVPGKSVAQVNFKVGRSSDMAATGFTYRISAQGCL